MRCISFFRETLSSTFLLFCFVLYLFFFIYSFINGVFFSWITCCASACINLRLEFSLYQRFFNNLPTLPHVPTASKASLFMLASEHPRCTRGPWRIVLPFFATSTTTFSDLRAVQVLLAICLWCPIIIWSKLNSEVGRRRLIRAKTSLRGCIIGHERCIKMTYLLRTYHNLLTK